MICRNIVLNLKVHLFILVLRESKTFSWALAPCLLGLANGGVACSHAGALEISTAHPASSDLQVIAQQPLSTRAVAKSTAGNSGGRVCTAQGEKVGSIDFLRPRTPREASSFSYRVPQGVESRWTDGGTTGRQDPFHFNADTQKLDVPSPFILPLPVTAQFGASCLVWSS